EDRVEQVGGAVEHLRMIVESRRRVDVSFDANDLSDAFEIARRCGELSDRVDRTQPGRLVAMVEVEVSTELAGVSQFSLQPWWLAGGEDQAAGADPRLVGPHGRRSGRQGDPQLAKVFYSGHRVILSVRDALSVVRGPAQDNPCSRQRSTDNGQNSGRFILSLSSLLPCAQEARAPPRKVPPR